MGVYIPEVSGLVLVSHVLHATQRQFSTFGRKSLKRESGTLHKLPYLASANFDCSKQLLVNYGSGVNNCLLKTAD